MYIQLRYAQISTYFMNEFLLLKFDLIMISSSFSLSLSLRAVKYHRALGVLFWIFATLHMLIYQVKWLQKGTLATNAWQNVRNIPRNNIDI